MCVTEAVDGGVGVMIAGAAVPARESGVGAELDHAEGNGRAGKRVAVFSGADEGIDVAREILLREDGQRQQENQSDGIYKMFLVSPAKQAHK